MLNTLMKSYLLGKIQLINFVFTNNDTKSVTASDYTHYQGLQASFQQAG